MKTHYIIIVIIIALFSLAGCTVKENFDYKVTVVPESKNVILTLNSMNSAAKVISSRLNKSFGIPLESMKMDITEKQISLTISNADTGKIASFKKMITDNASIEFWETFENSEVIGYLTSANNLLKNNLKRSESASLEEFKIQNPLFGLLRPMVSEKGDPLQSCMIGLASGKDTSEVEKYLKMEQVKALFPVDIKFFWSAKPYRYDKTQTLIGLHAIKVTTSDRNAPLDGSAIVSSKTASVSSTSGVIIDLKMSEEGSKIWAAITRESINRCIAVTYNGYVRSYPRVMGEITGGNTEITGDFTISEANDLVSILNSGQMPFELRIIDEQIIKRE